MVLLMPYCMPQVDPTGAEGLTPGAPFQDPFVPALPIEVMLGMRRNSSSSHFSAARCPGLTQHSAFRRDNYMGQLCPLSNATASPDPARHAVKPSTRMRALTGAAQWGTSVRRPGRRRVLCPS